MEVKTMEDLNKSPEFDAKEAIRKASEALRCLNQAKAAEAQK